MFAPLLFGGWGAASVPPALPFIVLFQLLTFWPIRNESTQLQLIFFACQHCQYGTTMSQPTSDSKSIVPRKRRFGCYEVCYQSVIWREIGRALLANYALGGFGRPSSTGANCLFEPRTQYPLLGIPAPARMSCRSQPESRLRKIIYLIVQNIPVGRGLHASHGRGAGVGRALGVGVGLGVELAVPVGVAVGVAVAVAVALAVAVAVGVAVGVAVALAVAVGVAVAVAVGEGVGVGPVSAQYLPPDLKAVGPLFPPQTIISLPLHTAV
jgi:hypothetical protein